VDGFAVVQNPEVAEPPWSEQMRRVAYVAEGLISCDKLYILIYIYVYLITTCCQHNLRDVGVAGSNPVTPTIDFIRVFPPKYSMGPSAESLWVPDWVPVFES
jgi:hypothetical protein